MVVFITGATSGIGRATALAFGREGAHVVVADISEEGAKDVVQAIEQTGGRALSARCDVSKEEDVRSTLDQAVLVFGGIDYAFNNAGVKQEAGPKADVSQDDFDRLLAIDLRGVLLCIKHQTPLLLQRGGGAIVITLSGAGVTAVRPSRDSLFTRPALDYANKNIRVNVVCPGIIETPMMDRFSGGTEEGRKRVIEQEPVGRMGKPEEIAAAVLFLFSDRAKFIVGHALVVDGGKTVGLF